MLFKLFQTNELVELDDSLIDLSLFLKDIYQKTQPLHLISTFLQTNSEYCGHKILFISTLEDVLEQCNTPHLSVIWLQDEKSAFMQKLNHYLNGHSEEKVLRKTLAFVCQHLDSIIDPKVYVLKFVKDKILKLVIQYLRIQSPKRGNDMFKMWPTLMQNCPPQGNMKDLTDSDLHVYIEFVESIPEEDLKDVIRASLTLGVESLKTLLACFISKQLADLDEQIVREKYQIPDKFKSQTYEKLRQSVKNIYRDQNV